MKSFGFFSLNKLYIYIVYIHHKKLHFSYKYILELYSFVSVYVRVCGGGGRYVLKIYYLLRIYSKRIIKTNQGNKMMT